MKYDFTSLMDRHNMDAIAVAQLDIPRFSITVPKERFSVIPMWVSQCRMTASSTNPTISV